MLTAFGGTFLPYDGNLCPTDVDITEFDSIAKWLNEWLSEDPKPREQIAVILKKEKSGL